MEAGCGWLRVAGENDQGYSLGIPRASPLDLQEKLSHFNSLIDISKIKWKDKHLTREVIPFLDFLKALPLPFHPRRFI